MANGDDKLVRDPEELTPEERWRAMAMSAGKRPNIPAARPPEAPELVSQPIEYTPPRQPREPGTPMTLPEHEEQRGEELWQKLHPEKKTGWGRFGQIMGTIGQDVGEAAAPRVMGNIPGTRLNRELELRKIQDYLGQEEARQSTAKYQGAEAGRAEAEAGKARAETAALGYPKLLPGPENIQSKTDPITGEKTWQRAYEVPGTQDIIWRDEGSTLPTTGAAPTETTPGTIPSIVPQAAPTPPGAPVAAAPPTALGAPLPGIPPQPPKKPIITRGPEAKMTPQEKLHEDFLAAAAIPEAQRTEQQQQLYAQNAGRWGKEVPPTTQETRAATDEMNSLYQDAVKSLGKDAPRPPTILPTESAEAADKRRTDYENRISAALDRKAVQDANQGIRDLHLQLMQDQLRTKQQNEAAEARTAYGNLYAQENYRDKMDAWLKSPNYKRDVVWVDDVVNHARGGGLTTSPALTTTAGALIGGAPGAVAGAAAGLFGQAISGPAASYLDTLKKQGISPEGYDAMQAYFNALPGRVAYELTTQQLKASAMRSADLLSKVMQTIPSPNTKPEMFDRSFEQYYKPMNTLTVAKYRNQPGFVPPEKTEFYSAPGPTGGAAAPPPGANVRKVNPQTNRLEK